MLRGKNNLESNKYHKEPSPCVQNEMLQCENSDKHRVNADEKINIASVEETSLVAQTDYKIGVFYVFFAPQREFDRSFRLPVKQKDHDNRTLRVAWSTRCVIVTNTWDS